MSGVFIAFEGGDGAGKSTQVEYLAAHLAARGVERVVTRQPGGTTLGAKLRMLVLDPASGDVDHRAEALMYAADKAQHVHETIRPALARGAVVISDRYVDSMLAYQGAGRDLSLDDVRRLAWWAVGGLRPDLTVLLDADHAEAVEKLAVKDRLEAAGAGLHRRAREHFLALAAERPGEYLVLPARDDRHDIARRVAARVDEIVAARGCRSDVQG